MKMLLSEEKGIRKEKEENYERLKEKADADSHDKTEFCASRCPNKNHYVEYRSGAKAPL